MLGLPPIPRPEDAMQVPNLMSSNNPVYDDARNPNGPQTPEGRQALSMAVRLTPPTSIATTTPTQSSAPASLPFMAGPNRAPLPNLDPPQVSPLTVPDLGPSMRAIGISPGPSEPIQRPVPTPLENEQSELTRITKPPLQGPGAHTSADTGLSGIGQVHNPWARHGLEALEAVGSMFGPTAIAEHFIPGTQAHHDTLVKQQTGIVNQAEAQAADEENRKHVQAQEGLEGAQTNKANADAELALHPVKPTNEWAELKDPAIDPAHPELGPQSAFFNKNDPTKGLVYGNAPSAAAPKQPTEAELPLKGKVPQLNQMLTSRYQVLHPKAPLPTQYTIPADATQKDYDRIDKAMESEERATGTVAQQAQAKAMKEQAQALAAGNKDRSLDNQETVKGKELLDKAEGTYRTAAQGAQTLTDFVNSAKAGNKVTAQNLPLEGALEITTTAGTKRINRTEVEQYQGAGSLYDRVAGALGKLKAGQPIPPNVMDDSIKLAGILQSNAYKTYKDAHDSAVKRYGLKGEEPIPEPGAGNVVMNPDKPTYDALPKGAKYTFNGVPFTKK